MRKFLWSIFPLSDYSGPLQRGQAAGLYLGALLYALARLVLVLPDVLDRWAAQVNLEPGYLVWIHGLLLAGAVVVWGLVRQGQLTAAAGVMIGVLLSEGTLVILGDAWDVPRGLALLWAATVTAGLLLNRQQAGLVAGYVLVVLAGGGLAGLDDLNSSAQWERAAVYLSLAALTLGLVVLTTQIMRGVRRSQATTLPDASRLLIEIGAEVAQGLSLRWELDTFLQQIANSIQHRFRALYNVQIFLIEPGGNHAALRACTGAVGGQLLTQEYGVDIGSLSVVGRVTLTGEPLLIPDLSRDPVHKPHPLLPDTRTELAIPLVATDEVIGALDVQSTEINALDQTDVAILRAIANQLAMAVDGLRLYESVQRNMRENQALYQQTQASLREIERLNYQLTGRAWADYLRIQAASTALTLDLDSGQTTAQADWTDTLNQAVQQRRVITTTNEGQRVISMPIMVRNEAIGAMEFELASDDVLPDGALELVMSVSQRLGLALENRRLFDETQSIAQREALINDIGTELQAATGVDAIIQRAAQHLQEALSARQVTIRLGLPTNGPDRFIQEHKRK